MALVPPIKFHGGKQKLAQRFLELMPPRCKNPNKPDAKDTGYLHYVEPYFGGGALLLANDPEGISEVVNDINMELMHFWFCLADPGVFPDFVRQAQATQFSEALWQKANAKAIHGIARMPTSRAVEFFIRCRQSLAGRMKGFTGITRERTRRGMNAEVSAWLTAIEGLSAVHARLKRVLVLCSPALKVIAKEDGKRTFFYCDPPYLHSTRATVKEYGENEMTANNHECLLNQLAQIKGNFMLSGYRSVLYDVYAENHGWNRHDFDVDCKAAGGKKKARRIESVWTNY